MLRKHSSALRSLLHQSLNSMMLIVVMKSLGEALDTSMDGRKMSALPGRSMPGSQRPASFTNRTTRKRSLVRLRRTSWHCSEREESVHKLNMLRRPILMSVTTTWAPSVRLLSLLTPTTR